MPEGNGRSSQERTIERRSAGARTLLVPPQPFYRTAALPCPYLPGKSERKLVTELAGRDAAQFYNELSRAGFRRSHHLAYRPACAACSGCVPVRIPIAEFAHSRSLARIRRVNRDLRVRSGTPRASLEQYRLFVRYERHRHPESDMASMTFGDYRAMIEESPVVTELVEERDGEGVLLGACLVDILDDGLSAVYSFFAPDQAKRSLGAELVLSLVEEARRRGLPYVYLGYWVEHSPKMAYKARFRPLEGLGPEGWRRLAV